MGDKKKKRIKGKQSIISSNTGGTRGFYSSPDQAIIERGGRGSVGLTQVGKGDFLKSKDNKLFFSDSGKLASLPKLLNEFGEKVVRWTGSSGMVKAPEKEWEIKFADAQVNPMKFISLTQEALKLFGGLSSIPKAGLEGEAMRKVSEKATSFDTLLKHQVLQPFLNLFEGTFQSLTSLLQGGKGGGGINIEIPSIPDTSQALAILQKRLNETYGGLRGDIYRDLSTLQGNLTQTLIGSRGRVMGDLNTLLSHSVWEEPIQQAREIARGEALRFMDAAGIGGLGGSALMLSEIMQQAVQPLLVEKSRGQQSLLRGAQEILGGLESLFMRGNTELLGGAQSALSSLARDYLGMQYQLPFDVERQALQEAMFKYKTALDYYYAQLEPLRLILGAESREGVPPSSAEQFWTLFSALM